MSEENSHDALRATANSNMHMLAPDMDPDFYRAWYSDLEGLDDQQLLAHWLLQGKNEGRAATFQILLQRAGISDYVEEPFDPTFYSDYYPELGRLKKPLQLQAHYFIYGKKEGRFATLKQALDKHDINESLLPPSFDLAEFKSANAKTGVEATLQDLVRTLSGHIKHPFLFSENRKETAKHYITLAKDKLHKGERHLARGLLKSSLFFEKSSIAFEHIGNTYFDEKDFNAAASYYEEALGYDSNSRWLHSSYATCIQRKNYLQEAVEIYLQALQKNPDISLLQTRFDKAIEDYWNSLQGKLDVLSLLSKREELISTAVNAASFIYTCYLKSMGVIEPPSTPHKTNAQRVLIIGDHHISQCVRYRIKQKKEQLEAFGRSVTVVDWMDVSSSHTQLSLHDIVIFYRVPATPQTLKAMAFVNAMGKTSFYEIDDLIFDLAYPPAIETYGGYVDLDDYCGLTKGMALFHAAARFCRYGIASTESLKEKLQDLVFDQECIVHRNGLDSFNYFKTPADGPTHNIDIFYGSGTQAHNSDFIEQALPALDKLLSAHPESRLIIVGYLLLPRWFLDKHHQQVRQLPPTESIHAYWALLEKAHINIAVLHGDPLNDCKSELKWVEAACFGIPSVLSSTANYRSVVRNHENALLAETSDDWYDALENLVTDAGLRSSIGRAAQEHVRSNYGVTELGSQLLKSLDRISSSTTPVSKRKIALVNVFFPPQATGGATRVVSDNFDVLIDKHSDSYDICVFTSHADERTPHQLDSYRYKGMPVYRATVQHRENMDWHPKDEEMRKLFKDFLKLEQPDLVHFHCIQRLSASIVEATRELEIPYVVTAHDAWWISDYQFLVDQYGRVYPDGHSDPYEEKTLPQNVSFSASTERSVYLKSLLNDAAFTLSVSRHFGEIYKANGIHNVKENANGIKTAKWKAKETRSSRKVVCAHIGGMAEHKGYFIFKDAITNVQPLNIEVLVVDHSREDGHMHHAIWHSSEPGSRGVPVTVIGKTSQNSMSDLYAQIDVLFCPSTWPESFGLVSREANAAGCWVVASSLGGIGENITHGLNGFVVDPTVSALGTVIRRIDDHPEPFKESPPAAQVRKVEEQVSELVKYYEDALAYSHKPFPVKSSEPDKIDYPEEAILQK